MAWMDRRHRIASSRWTRWWFNQLLWRTVPFNKPHRVRVLRWDDEGVLCLLPYRKNNCNHLRGLHACALATLGEYASGLCLLARYDPQHYRLIMMRMEVAYHRQGRRDCTAHVLVGDMPEQDDGGDASSPLEVPMQVTLRDTRDAVLAVVQTHWQIKPWSSVKKRHADTV
jgi:acyl-coenzyme A thioesterase PaaI-like protein